MALEGLASLVTGSLSLVLSGQPVERVLDRTLRAHRHLSRDQRQVLAEALFNVSLWRRRLGFHLGTPEDAPGSSLLYAFLHLLAGLPSDVAARLAEVGTPPPRLVPDVPPSLALRCSLPDWLADHFAREWGPAAEDFCSHLNVPGPITLRVNRLRIDRDSLQSRLRAEGVETRPGLLSPLALHVVGPRPNLYGLASLREGLFEVQDEGSQLLGLLVEPRPGETVLDLCAGAGGKTLQLGAAMENQGRLLAYDPDAGRLDRLLQRCARAGLSNVHLLRAPPEGLLVDRVLVDAPCSELGPLRRGPDLRFRLAPSSLSELPRVQREILSRARPLVRPGGRLVYATCTVNRAENEDLVRGFLRDAPVFRLVPAEGSGALPGSCARDGFWVCAPHLHGCDAFFAAVLERTEG
ncbi:RsmB/NOP family class I SAM-dependent RNA methyltransferase [Cystobacter fuscus]|uniref:RsmB/NOP family class I SAM-dependent RNA methyltransferase n=1 Tax=Cystobacter fuscus TaxID=43 RepID=UPI0037C13D71